MSGSRRMRTTLSLLGCIVGLMSVAAPAPAATQIMRPNGDVSSGWSVYGAAAAWAAIDDPVTRSGAVGGQEYVYACAPGRVTEVTLGPAAIPGGEAPALSRAWVYSNTAAGASTRAELVTRGSVVGTLNVPAGQPYAWRPIDWTPASHSEVDDARLRFTYSSGSGCSNVRAAYFELDTRAPPPGDVTPPETTLSAGPSDVHRSGVGWFDFASSETDSTFQCRVDSGVFAPCSSPWRLHVANGGHSFEVRAIDASGNLDLTPARRTWWADGHITNGTFEAPLDGWSAYTIAGFRGYRSTLSQVPGGVAGTKARVVASSPGDYYSIYTYPRAVNVVSSGATYTATGWVRSETPGRTVCLRLQERAADNSGPATQRCMEATPAWQSLPETAHTAGIGERELEVQVVSGSPSVSNDSFEIDGLELRDGGQMSVALQPAAPAGDPVLLATADMALCSSSGDEAVARLIDTEAGILAPAGDTEQNDGSAEEFRGCYAPNFGRFNDRVRPAVGDHEYRTPFADPYWDHFGALAGARRKGWYSYDVGSWHVVVLNSNCSQVGGCGPGSEQYEWLANDLGANPRSCVAGYWHHPRFSQGSMHGPTLAVQPFWELLYRYGAEMVWGGNDHTYQRFRRQTPSGVRDEAHGIRQFVVGTGGATHYKLNPPGPNTEVQHAGTFGVLRLTLRDEGYDWRFLPQSGKSFTDSGSATCSTTRPDLEAPRVALTAPSDGATVSGNVAMSADAADAATGVERVEFLVGGAVVATDTSAPYSAAWDSRSGPDGAVTIRARAADAAGNVASSSEATVTVANGSASPPSNLLPNPGFEIDTSGWFGYRGTLTRVAGGAEGGWSGRLAYGGTGSSYSIATSPRPVAPSTAGRRYTATAAVNAPFGKRICLRMREFDSGGAVIGSAQTCLSGTGAWITSPTLRYTATGGASLDMYLFQDTNIVSGDAFSVDALSLTAE